MHYLWRQVDGMKLDADTAMRKLEADAAMARKAAAQTETRYKTEKAAWMTDLEMQKFEVRGGYLHGCILLYRHAQYCCNVNTCVQFASSA